MRRFVSGGTTDVGRVRDGNEDAYLVADSVVAVADGMGGHVAGEVASATALEPIRELDGRIFPDSTEALTALRDAVVTANHEVSERAESEPSYRGMGTTLTAALIEGRRLHVAHVGDSRAYLLRGGSFSQLTDDHTLVQHLIDEGQLTREEAANHPQRSVVTRAIGVSREVDVDAMTLELHTDDQVLLCSDGLTGVVSDDQIAKVLQETEDLEETLRILVDMANDAGGPDNITVVLIRFEDTDDEEVDEHSGPKTVAISTLNNDGDADWAGRLGSYGSFGTARQSYEGAGTERSDDASRFGGLVMRSLAILVGIAVLGGIVYGGGRFLLSQNYYVGLDDEQVVIYQGLDAELGNIRLSRVAERSDLTLDDIPSYFHLTLQEGLNAADINDARRQVRGIPTREEAETAGDEDDEVEDGGQQDNADATP
jgi:PPM family protein phosphatase